MIENDWLTTAIPKLTRLITPDVEIKPLYIIIYHLHDIHDSEKDCRKSSVHLSVTYPELGPKVYQHASFISKTWHAGQSYYQGHAGLNSYAIGIALSDIRETKILHEIIPEIVEEYDIRDIVTHAMINPRSKSGEGFPLYEFLPYVNYGNAESAGRYIVGVPQNQHLRVRGGPGVNFDILDVLKNGDTVKVLRTEGLWHHIKYQRSGEKISRHGWALETYLRRT